MQTHRPAWLPASSLSVEQSRPRARSRATPPRLPSRRRRLTFAPPLLPLSRAQEMAKKMGWTHLDNPFEYSFERGLYYHYITPLLVVGSQPRNALDVDHLADEGVDVILNLQQVRGVRVVVWCWVGGEGGTRTARSAWGRARVQRRRAARVWQELRDVGVAMKPAAVHPPAPHKQRVGRRTRAPSCAGLLRPLSCLLLPRILPQDKDLAYWKVSLEEISGRAGHHGMQLVRTPAVDFSPHSLRDTLPKGGWAGGRVGGQRCRLGCGRRPALQEPGGVLHADALAPLPLLASHPHAPLCPLSCAAVRALEQARACGQKVYVHCTAGLGRSPAVAIAALFWWVGGRVGGWVGRPRVAAGALQLEGRCPRVRLRCSRRACCSSRALRRCAPPPLLAAHGLAPPPPAARAPPPPRCRFSEGDGLSSLDEAYSFLTGIRPCGPSRVSRWTGRGVRDTRRGQRCAVPRPPAACPALLPPARRAAAAAARCSVTASSLPPSPPQQDAIRGATYDLLSGRPHDHFQHEPSHAFATLSAHDRARIRSMLLGSS